MREYRFARADCGASLLRSKRVESKLSLPFFSPPNLPLLGIGTEWLGETKADISPPLFLYFSFRSCYNKIMQPDQQKNYWEQDPEIAKTDGELEMYVPTADDDSSKDVNEDAKYTRPSQDSETVHWVASEYIAAEKGSLWFVIFGIIAAALIATDIIFIKSYSFSVLVVVMALAVVMLSRRPPQQINYTLSGQQGLYVGEQLHHFSEFKSFGLVSDDGNHSIMLVPIKRFSLGVSVYFPQDVGEQIIDILGARLPMEDMKLDLVDKIVRKLRL